MAEITLKNVCKRYEKENLVVNNCSLTIHDKEFMIFVGPSGCGKSTTLRMIAGLEEISDGELWIDGQLANYLEPKERELSMVFQNYALYPHMTVYDNMAFSLKVRKVPKREIEERVNRVAKMLEIEHLLKRRPRQLSGGQKQRVAIGSAIIRSPKAFLMDEPLSNLDAKLRAQMRVELSKLHRELGTTIIYVTHDQTEAMTLGTRIAVMKDGIVQQVDTPKNIYNNPVNRFVAGFLGAPSMNFLEASVAEIAGNIFLVFENKREKKTVLLDGKKAEILRNGYIGKTVILGIRPEHIYEFEVAKALGMEGKSKTIFKKAEAELVESGIMEVITAKELLGADVIGYFEDQGRNCSVRVSAENHLCVGTRAFLYFDTEKIQVFDKTTEENLFFNQYEDNELDKSACVN